MSHKHPAQMWFSLELAKKKGIYPLPDDIPHRVEGDKLFLSPQDLDKFFRREIQTHPPSLRNMASRALHGIKSKVQTSLGQYRVTPEQHKTRMDICAQCPGGHVEFKNGKPFSCGPLLGNKPKTCGCNIPSKARDIRENCPNGYWPTVNQS
jgi:hypothetical protein